MYNSKEIKVISTAKKKSNPYNKDVILTEEGQWKYPGQVTKIPSSDITMKGVNYPVLGIDNLGHQQMMQPGMDYTFPGQYVTEYPQMQDGGGYIPVGYYPSYQNPDGTYSNEVSMGLNVDNQEMLLPSFWDGQRHNEQETEARYRKTGEHLGKFDTVADSERAAKLREFMNNEVHPYSMQNGGWLDQYQSGGSIDAEKARAFLEDGSIYGHPLTQKQIDYFSQIAGVEIDATGEIIELEEDEEFKKGGFTIDTKARMPRQKTSKNIKSSINKLFLRNKDLFGPSGQRLYDPNTKTDSRNWLDKYK